ncbi:MAG: 23S rRNA (adenine(2030)-N(6))-methyltransferase RlmJ [Betaproteobacteria bacterium]|nr:23S rRNA (adenine(2030)-N(6))-methyltransferase RlmJ [Betaproteobacteria bacterium]
MLSYRHLFHAGNFADVFKHSLLARLLTALCAKDKAWCYLDTHAGTGRYDLSHPWAQKVREYENGISRLWGRRDLPALLAPYMAAVQAANPAHDLKCYPGSPLIARWLARPGDRLVLSELNQKDCAALNELFARDKQVQVQLMDGYQALKAFLPPQERRGLVLIDSSFDRAREFDRVTKALAEAHARFATGTYAVWYPLMEKSAMRGFEREILKTGIRKVLKLELTVEPENWTLTVPGCGMLVVNPPWTFEEEARTLLDWLWITLANAGAGGVKVDWLVPE